MDFKKIIEMDFKEINPLIHQYHFPVHDLIRKEKEDILQQNREKCVVKGLHNNLYDNPNLTKQIFSKFESLVESFYDVSPLLNEPGLFTYVQSNVKNSPIFHHHLNKASLSGVLYIDPPKQGGELEFIIGERFFKIKPEVNMLYIFPGWLYHRPLAQKDVLERVSINMEYLCMSRPRHKITKFLW